MMRPLFAEAVDQRLRWAEWAKTGMMGRVWSEDPVLRGAPESRYKDNLEVGDLFVMVPEFCRLVDHARRAMPDDVRVDAQWLHAPAGWCYLAEPFETPIIGSYRGTNSPPVGSVRAVGWYPIPAGFLLVYQDGTRGPAPPGTTGFLTYTPHGLGFTPFSYFTLVDGDAVGPRVEGYERQARSMTPIRAQRRLADGREHLSYTGAYEDPEGMWKHEIRWTIAALHLMAQRLAVAVPHPLDRAARRRVERTGRLPPPFVRAITLRRLEAARQRDPRGEAVDWQWQWEVTGHWRRKPHSEERIFIAAYVKGPADKPFKTGGLKLFVARR